MNFFKNDPDPFVENNNGLHRESCVWSNDGATEGPDTCQCSMEYIEAKRWIQNHVCPDLELTRFGIHWSDCPLMHCTNDTSVDNLRWCTCMLSLKRVLKELKFPREPLDATIKTTLDQVLSQVQSLSTRVDNVTKLSSKTEPVEIKKLTFTAGGRRPPSLLMPQGFASSSDHPSVNGKPMALRVYYKPKNNYLYFLRRQPENMKRSEEIFVSKHDLHKEGMFLTMRNPFNVELHQLMSEMKQTMFPLGKQTGRVSFFVGDDVKHNMRLDMTWMLSKLNQVLDTLDDSLKGE